MCVFLVEWRFWLFKINQIYWATRNFGHIDPTFFGFCVISFESKNKCVLKIEPFLSWIIFVSFHIRLHINYNWRIKNKESANILRWTLNVNEWVTTIIMYCDRNKVQVFELINCSGILLKNYFKWSCVWVCVHISRIICNSILNNLISTRSYIQW